MELDERKLRILAAIVSQYIRSGEPVGSKTISMMEGIGVSPATIRNEMASLFDMGLLEQPHTSAGRVPSHLGYRVYLDRLMRPAPLTEAERDEVDALFNVGDPDPDRLVLDATRRLADYTGCVTVSATRTAASVVVAKVELIPADEYTVVILIMASNGVLRSKICRVEFRVTRSLCDFFQKFAGSRLIGRSLYEITTQYLSAVAVSLGEYSRVFLPMLSAIFELCREIYDGLYCYSGEVNLLRQEGASETAHDLFALVCSRDRMTRLLCGEGNTVSVTIGKENHLQELVHSSLVMAPYRISGDSSGVIAIIGPVRMPYDRLIPHLEYFAERLGTLLTKTYRRDTADDDAGTQSSKGDDLFV